MAKISHKQWYSNPKYKGIPYRNKQFYERFDTEAAAQRVLDAHTDLIPHEEATWQGPGGYRWDEWRTWDVRRRAFYLEHYVRFKAAKAAEYAEAEARSNRVNAGLELRWWQRRKFAKLIEKGEQPDASAQDRRNAESARRRFRKAGLPVPHFHLPQAPESAATAPETTQRRESEDMIGQVTDPLNGHPSINAEFWPPRSTRFAHGRVLHTEGITLDRPRARKRTLVLRSRGHLPAILRMWAPDHDGSAVVINGTLVGLARHNSGRWEGTIAAELAEAWRTMPTTG